MRLFVAAELPEPMIEALSETTAALRDVVHGRFVSPDRFHVTLAFLGEVPVRDVERISEAVEGACLGHSPFAVTLGALGTFGHGRRVALWQGFSRGTDDWATLSCDVRRALEAEGLTFDGRRFVPHVTLMYRAQILTSELPMPHVTEDVIHTVTLFSSDLSGDVPCYDPLSRVELR